MKLFYRSALLLACLTLLGACSKAGSANAPAIDIEKARRDAEAIQHALAKLPPSCTVGTAVRPEGQWLLAPKAYPEPGQPYTSVLQFEMVVSTGAVRAGLNRAALRALEKVETRDAQGRWQDAGPVSIHEAPEGCDYVWLQQDLGGQRQVAALRYAFRRSEAPVTVANAAVFQAN